MKRLVKFAALMLVAAAMFIGCKKEELAEPKIIATYRKELTNSLATRPNDGLYRESIYVFDNGDLIYDIEMQDDKYVSYNWKLHFSYTGSIPKEDLSIKVSGEPTFSTSGDGTVEDVIAWYNTKLPSVFQYVEGKSDTLKAYYYGEDYEDQGYYSLFMKNANGFSTDWFLIRQED